MKRRAPHRLLLLLLLAASLSTVSVLAGDQKPGRYEAEITVKVRLDHLLYVPEHDTGAKLPLLVFLHGAGERGDDLERVKKHGPPKLIEGGRDFPFIVLSPLCERGRWWRADAVIQLVDHIVATQPVDPDRVYLTGLSMGGFGTFDLATKYPDRFAAVAPICGGGEPATAAAMAPVPTWVFHGAKDRVVELAASERMVEALKAVGGDVRFTVYPEAGHDSWTESYANEELYAWFLSHDRSQRPTGTAVADASREIPRAEPEEVGMAAAKLAGIDDAVASLVDGGRLAGAVVVVARRGRVVHESAYGNMDLDDELPMNLDTIFRIHSMTKPVTSVGVMMLIEDGRLSLEDPVSKILPELAGLKVFASGNAREYETEPAQREMTIADLLRHTSGFTYGFFGTSVVDQLYAGAGILWPTRNLEETVKELGKLPLLFQPGKRWVYGVNTDVLGRVIEVISGESLDAFFRERIFEPLDMKDTGFRVPEAKLSRFASNYSPGLGGGLRETEGREGSPYAREPKLLSGGGGLVSTARDYLRFAQMLANGGELHGRRLLDRETIAAMTTNHIAENLLPLRIGPMSLNGIGFGYGFSVRLTPAGDDAHVGEYGWAGAASTHFWVSPRDDVVVVALSQVMPYTDQLENAVKPIIYGAITD